MIGIFHKDYPKKPIKILLSIDITSLMAKQIAKQTVKPLIDVAKKKQNKPAKKFVK